MLPHTEVPRPASDTRSPIIGGRVLLYGAISPEDRGKSRLIRPIALVIALCLHKRTRGHAHQMHNYVFEVDIPTVDAGPLSPSSPDICKLIDLADY